MRSRIYSMKDVKLGEFTSTFTEENDQHAIRGLKNIIARQDNDISKYAEDFELYFMGEINQKNGAIKAPNSPEMIISGAGARYEVFKLMGKSQNQVEADLGNMTEKLHQAIKSVNDKVGS